MPVDGTAVLGLNAVSYENTAYTTLPGQAAVDTPTMLERSNVQDVTINQSMATADVSTRGGGGYRQVQGTLAEGSIDFVMIYAPGDAFFDSLNTAFADRVLRDLMWADGVAVNGTDIVVAGDIPTGSSISYFRAEMAVLDFTQEQPLEDALKVNVTLQSGFTSFSIPGWTTIPGSAGP